MEEYLSTTINKLNSGEYADLHIVLGNESCDLDSAVCSVVYAAFLNYQYNQIKCKVCTPKQGREESVYKDDIFVPILDVPREDYEIKTEVAHCFNSHSIDKSKLVFRDDIDLKSLVTKKNMKVILVDHHILCDRYSYLTPYVTEIIDHRPIDNINWQYKEDTRSTIELVGSCATLVSQRIIDLGNLLHKGLEFFHVYTMCSDMLLSTIIVDTSNFSKKSDKGTPKDEEIAKFHENILKPDNFEATRLAILNTLLAAKTDVSRLTPAQLLRKDVKEIENILIPTLPHLVEEFLEKPGAAEAVREALGRTKCSTALILGVKLTGELKKDGAILSIDNEKSTELFNYLDACTQPKLDIIRQDSPQAPGFVHFIQKNLKASRKQYLPFVTEYINIQKNKL